MTEEGPILNIKYWQLLTRNTYETFTTRSRPLFRWHSIEANDLWQGAKEG